MNLLLLILGLVLTVVGADWLVNGSVAVAKRYRMPEFLIGITIVGIGTSMPELVVSLFASLSGRGSIAIGNVLGSNLANTLLILGAAAVIRPISFSRDAIKTDIPYNILVSAVLLLMCFGFRFWVPQHGGIISRVEGAVLLAMFAIYMFYSFRSAANSNNQNNTDIPDVQQDALIWKSLIAIAAGITGLALGGRWFVNGASGLAAALGVSETIIAITIVAIGTSLPELATAVVASVKGRSQLALGNIIGSNIFNICLILGVSSVARPLNGSGIMLIDIAAPLAAVILLWISAFTLRGRRINRTDGVIFLAVYIAYVVYLALR